MLKRYRPTFEGRLAQQVKTRTNFVAQLLDAKADEPKKVFYEFLRHVYLNNTMITQIRENVSLISNIQRGYRRHLASFNGRRNVLENDIWEKHKTSLLANLVQRKSSRTNLLKVAKGEGSKLCDGGH